MSVFITHTSLPNVLHLKTLQFGATGSTTDSQCSQLTGFYYRPQSHIAPRVSFEAFKSLFAQTDKALSCKTEVCHSTTYLTEQLLSAYVTHLPVLLCFVPTWHMTVCICVCMWLPLVCPHSGLQGELQHNRQHWRNRLQRHLLHLGREWRGQGTDCFLFYPAQEINVNVIFPENGLLYWLWCEVCCWSKQSSRAGFVFFGGWGWLQLYWPIIHSLDKLNGFCLWCKCRKPLEGCRNGGLKHQCRVYIKALRAWCSHSVSAGVF